MIANEIPTVTVTIHSGGQDFTVSVALCTTGEWMVCSAIDEDGTPVPLDEDETREAVALAEAGIDETGR